MYWNKYYYLNRDDDDDDDDIRIFFEKIVYDGFIKHAHAQIMKYTKLHESLVDLVLTRF